MSFLFKFKTNYEKRSFKVPIQPNETLVGAVINNVSEAMETLTRITEELVPVPGSVNGVNALGLVVFSMCFGFVIGNMGTLPEGHQAGPLAPGSRRGESGPQTCLSLPASLPPFCFSSLSSLTILEHAPRPRRF